MLLEQEVRNTVAQKMRELALRMAFQDEGNYTNIEHGREM